MLKKWTVLLAVGLLAASLAACGDDKKEDAAKENAASSVQNDTDKTKSNEEQDDDTGAVELKEDQLGISAKEFQADFNEAAETEGIAYRVNHSQWSDPRNGLRIVDILLDEDYRIQLLGNEGEENVRALMLDADGNDDIRTIKALIKTVDKQATDGDIDNILKELKLIDSQDEKQEYTTATLHSYQFLLRNQSGIELIIANEKDPLITEENWKNGEF
ncbi:hypothetical protein [Sporosarcina sp. Te-1]|uniref:hypothetical protein n=1 Tax=Sporosarcina sp. Te-1 TaxID=2818390 RepID=UPI001A9F0776|nr:hypothetical protein [Sporosarcina sp. Te-1]QTD41777.1 hypothetical protein J3U78_02675 [Sporosarcina sp. Te-1]